MVVAGGIGLAPLRSAVRSVLDRRPRTVGAGSSSSPVARSPDQILFGDDLELWRRAGAEVAVTVDVGTPGWDGHVGRRHHPARRSRPFDPARRLVALLCGPEIMMRFAARGLVDRGVDPARILVSLERNMQCGLGSVRPLPAGPAAASAGTGRSCRYGGLADRLLMERGR